MTVAAVITPSGDPFSMLALAVPLYVFYEISIVIGKLRRVAADLRPITVSTTCIPVQQPGTGEGSIMSTRSGCVGRSGP